METIQEWTNDLTYEVRSNQRPLCNGKGMDPLVTIAVCIYCDHNDSWRSSVAAILGEDVVFTRPSLQCLDRIQRMSLYTTREEGER